MARKVVRTKRVLKRTPKSPSRHTSEYWLTVEATERDLILNAYNTTEKRTAVAVAAVIGVTPKYLYDRIRYLWPNGGGPAFKGPGRPPMTEEEKQAAREKREALAKFGDALSFGNEIGQAVEVPENIDELGLPPDTFEDPET